MTKITLRSWLLLCSLLPALLLSVFCAGYFSYVRHQELALSFTGKAGQIGQTLALSSSALLQQTSSDSLNQLLMQSHQQNSPYISNISLVSATKPVFHTNALQFNDHLLLAPGTQLSAAGKMLQQQQQLLFYIPLYNSNDSYLLLQLPIAELQLRQHQAVLYGLLLALAALLLVCLPAYWLLLRVTKPLQNISQQVTQLVNGAMPGPAIASIVTELNTLQHSLQQLGNSLQEQQQETEQQFEQITSDLQLSMEQLEVQNIQLDFARRKALEENRQKSEFLAKMSHELRTPLNGVIGFTRQLLKTRLSGAQQDYLTTIQKSANSLLHLVNDVLDFSKLEEGRLSINPEPFSLRDLLHDATELLAANAFDKHLELVLLVEPSCPDDLVADPARFTQILMNIAGNAIKFTDHGSIVIRVSATLLNEDQLILHCSVQDTGCGISEEQQSLLFQGFSPSTERSHQTGSGLGLMISQRLVKAMSGNIGFESRETEGSTFWFTIKCLRHQLSVADSLPTDALENKQILYFEPQQHSREATLSLLHSWGLQVTACATKGQLQQALAKQQRYDIGLIGRTIAINQVNQVISLIEQINAVCDHNCVLVNTLSPHLRETLLNSGADAVLSKPPHIRKLAATLSAPYQQQQQSQLLPVSSTRSNLKVLTVDDNEANLKLINTLLAEHVLQIDSARDGAIAWHKATQHAYDIIFMDINMPVMDGVTACQRIRQSSLNEHTPIIAVTAQASEGERARLLTLGFNEFLSKPLDETMLYCSLQEYCPAVRLAASTDWPASKLVDWVQAQERAGGKTALVKDMLQMLLDSIAPTCQALQQALQDDNNQQVLQLVHKLHGACCYTGVPRLKSLAELLETQLKQGKSLAELEPEFLELDDVMQALWQESRLWNW
ncbi:response regulator [Rheinheimera muenzenbergensis]|uniref:histidine kinase n=1 Tax=Rheinheimera muenzenbergensis TaxID=1193628 RepID=A0ABU8C3G1_9GAMM